MVIQWRSNMWVTVFLKKKPEQMGEKQYSGTYKTS